MRLDDYRTSENVERGSGGGFGFGGGGGGFGLLLALVGSRFGIGGIIVLVIGAVLLGFNPFGLGGSGQQAVAPHQARSDQSAAQICASNAPTRFSCQVLASTEDVWGRIFASSGQTYVPTTLHLYDRSAPSGCGMAQSAMGPFYCPTDKKIYLDLAFFQELQNRFQAPGDFAQAYVIAHEVGHHIQDLTGTLGQAQAEQSRLSAVEGNAVQVQVELQADCYAGVWAANARDAQGRTLLEPGDVEEGMRAAEAIGDDTLQKAAQGYVVPDSFTHGTSAQRMHWLRTGLQTGDPAACDTFASS